MRKKINCKTCGELQYNKAFGDCNRCYHRKKHQEVWSQDPTTLARININRRKRGLTDKQHTDKLNRLKSRKYGKKPCEVCKEPNTHRHHKDKDPSNNKKENIAWFCQEHHALEHRKMV